MANRGDARAHVCHRDERYPDRHESAVKVAELENAEPEHAVAVVVLSVAGVVEGREEHGEEEDDGFGVVRATVREENAENEQQVAERQEEDREKYLGFGTRVRVVRAVPTWKKKRIY